MAKKTTRKRRTITAEELLCLPEIGGCNLVEVSQIHPFKTHPFKVQDDDQMHELVESIMQKGMLTPVVVRKIENGEFEMICGHRRLFAAKQIGLERIPATVMTYSDDEAVIALVDSNLQRELLPSEKAFAYRMRYEAMKHLDHRKDKALSKGEKMQWADMQLAEDVGESRNQIHRYLRLTEVIPPILDLVDKKVLALMTAVEISYLASNVQEMLYAYMQENDICKSFQIYALRDYFKDHDTITQMELIRILNENAPVNENNRFQKITISKEKLRHYFPVFYTKSQMENVMFGLLEEWKKENNKAE